MDKQQLNKILEEIVEFDIELVQDPTLPQYGTRYLQEKIAACRNYSSRVQRYLQLVKRLEKNIRTEVKQLELDLEFKITERLADDPVVRQQPSEGIKRAVAVAQLKQEYDKLSELKIRLIDVQETAKIIKFKYDDLKQINSDIKLQRQLIKDELTDPSDGIEPSVKKSKLIDPRDLLDPSKRPEDLPVPVDLIHATQIASFYNITEPEPEPEKKVSEIIKPNLDYSDLLDD